ncbi:hypothetical protein ACU686_06975 [Yinghuangia aomiensis]
MLRNLVVNAVEHGEDATCGDRRGQRRRGRGDRARLRRRPQARRSRPLVFNCCSSGAPTRPAPAPPAAPAPACRSRWRTPTCTAGGCRPGASRAADRGSGSRCRAHTAANWSAHRCRWSRPTRRANRGLHLAGTLSYRRGRGRPAPRDGTPPAGPPASNGGSARPGDVRAAARRRRARRRQDVPDQEGGGR